MDDVGTSLHRLKTAILGGPPPLAICGTQGRQNTCGTRGTPEGRSSRRRLPGASEPSPSPRCHLKMTRASLRSPRRADKTKRSLPRRRLLVSLVPQR
ncbi:hypothetical protein AAFF_G00060780 [Aldrovandia affinis]|uniref:Uncharacterized protein n=1 Tax=Aldrovandia affinis TaxID=143900 RepID=A0AAD7WDQ0_9TELE|nr:hypothetical protein AAFF_G00060780 [Aldrovandia affinis]